MTDPQTSIRIATAQMTCRLGDKDANLAQAEQLLASLSGKADIVCLPELFNTGYHLDAVGDSYYDLAEAVPDGETTRRLVEMAARFDLAIIAGLVEAVPNVTGFLYDTVLLIERDGQLSGSYRKTHLYPAEHSYFQPGDRLPVFTLGGLTVGLAICFEAAFPPIFSTLALQGAQVVFNPSAVPRGYGYLQDLRTQARAQDNQIFVVASNHVGDEGGVVYCGRSQIANPRGEVIALASGDRPEAVVAELDLSLIRNQRLQEPIFRGFREEMYQFSPDSRAS